MSSALRIRRPVQVHESLPADIYLPLVDSLYKDSRTLISGSVFAAIAIFTTYWKTGEIILLYCAIAVVFVSCARGLVMYEYLRARSTVTSTEIAKRWEHRYVAGATVSVALLGIWCFVAFSQTSDAFAHLVSFSLTAGYLAGIFGRNFANARFVIVQIFCAWLPMTAALLFYGNLFHWIFAGLLVPSFLAIKFIADRWRRTLLDAVICIARHVDARKAIRHRTQQHAARFVHVRFQASHRRLKSKTEATNGIARRIAI